VCISLGEEYTTITVSNSLMHSGNMQRLIHQDYLPSFFWVFFFLKNTQTKKKGNLNVGSVSSLKSFFLYFECVFLYQQLCAQCRGRKKKKKE
jgi:hypothetical protein